MNQETLTYDKLAQLCEEFPPLPFVAFTMRPPIYSALRSQCELASDPLSHWTGTRVYSVQLQEEDCLQWNDEALLLEYLKAHDAMLRIEKGETRTDDLR